MRRAVRTVEHRAIPCQGRAGGVARVGGPDDCIEHCKEYQETGCDLLLRLLNPYQIPQGRAMQSIELLGTYVIPQFG